MSLLFDLSSAAVMDPRVLLPCWMQDTRLGFDMDVNCLVSFWRFCCSQPHIMSRPTMISWGCRSWTQRFEHMLNATDMYVEMYVFNWQYLDFCSFTGPPDCILISHARGSVCVCVCKEWFVFVRGEHKLIVFQCSQQHYLSTTLWKFPYTLDNDLSIHPQVSAVVARHAQKPEHQMHQSFPNTCWKDSFTRSPGKHLQKYTLWHEIIIKTRLRIIFRSFWRILHPLSLRERRPFSRSHAWHQRFC